MQARKAQGLIDRAAESEKKERYRKKKLSDCNTLAH